ncbi:MAG: 1-deoxy-D-xylulose-5-phosphate synthase [Pseudonocardiales bacterium]|nr:1-deoxy-D-xylulose-5-phosphate synthase [Pseudonocardiales bacterium]MBV9730384.1 1-deoxy-D-xylulose-5-phosphate synthase [Pseudonocardiales bacterium]
MTLLQSVCSPQDVKRLDMAALTQLAAEIRSFLVEKVSRTGGHLGPNLGAVELTLAVHRVFDSPHDPVIFDTGHQAYVHKIVTGRAEGFDRLRKRGGLSGYPSRAESEHDWVESSHASAALSYADGLSKAFAHSGAQPGASSARCRHVVAVVGDGALTGGMCWEALNNIAAGKDRSVIIVVNDNGRSYSPTIGGFADHLSTLRLQPSYELVLRTGKQALKRTPVVGRAIYAGLHAAKRGLKDALAPQILFEDLGLKYLGPIDGHDLRAMETALRRAKDFGGPVIVHAVTRKGNGYLPAENDVAELMHQVKVMDPETGAPIAPVGISWTDVFTEELIRLAGDREDLMAITAAMPGPTGLAAFAKRFPDRCFDVGIAEQHAVTSAAGLALGGLHPVVSLYSTFLNRAFDQLLMDVALLSAPVTITLDRAGVTGDDGASHNGMWDLSVLGIVPGIRVAAPRDAGTLREELAEAVAVDDGPTAVRFPKGPVIEEVPALERIEGVDVLVRPGPAEGNDVLLVGIGAFAALAVAAAGRLADQGIGVTVVDPRWVLPVPEVLVRMAAAHRLVVSVEDGGRHGGFGWSLAAALRDAEIGVPCRDLGIPQRFLAHGSRDEVLADLGLTAQGVARAVTGWAAGLIKPICAPDTTVKSTDTTL